MEKYGNNNEEFYINDGDDSKIHFDNGDLYYSIHGGSIFIKRRASFNYSVAVFDSDSNIL